MSLEINLIAKIIEKRSLLEVYQNGITIDSIKETSAKAIWRYIEDHYRQFKEIPSKEIINQKFEMTLPTVTDSIEFISEEIAQKCLGEDLNNFSYEVRLRSTKSKPSDVLQFVYDFARQKREAKSKSAQIIPFGTLTDKLIFDYEEAKQGKTGILTHWSTMNDWTLGWWKADVSWLSARLGVGKSFWLILIALAAREKNHKILFISGEMSKEDIAKRTASLEAKLSYSNLRRGKLGFPHEDKFFDYLKNKRTDLDFEIMDASFGFTTNEIELAIDKTKADLILIDASYRIKASQKSRDRFDNMALVADELKQLAMRYSKAIVCTTQLNRASISKKNFGDDDIALSDVVGWNATNLFAMKQSEENRKNNIMEIHPLKVREGENARSAMLINWDFKHMNFTEYDPNQQNQKQEDGFDMDDYAG